MFLVTLIFSFGATLIQQFVSIDRKTKILIREKHFSFLTELCWIFGTVHHWLAERFQRKVFGGQSLFINHGVGVSQRIKSKLPRFKLIRCPWRGWEFMSFEIVLWSHDLIKRDLGQSCQLTRSLGVQWVSLRWFINRFSLNWVEQLYLELPLRKIVGW